MSERPMSNESVTLLPCPFCGAPGFLGDGDHGSAFVECSADCEMNVRAQKKTAEEAAALWNRRSKPVASGTVKPLEWEENSPNSVWTGELAFGVYYVAWDEGTGWRAFRKQFLSEATEVEIAYGAKAVVLGAAEADYRNRIMSALLPKATAPEVSEPVAWMVERSLRAGGTMLCLPVLRPDEVERYRQNNPDEKLQPLFSSPQPLPGVTEEAIERVAQELLAHGEFSSIPWRNHENALFAARAALEAFVKEG